MSLLGDDYSVEEECDECGEPAGAPCVWSCPIRAGARYDLA